PRMSMAITSRSAASACATLSQSYEKYERPWTMRTGVAPLLPSFLKWIETSPERTRPVWCGMVMAFSVTKTERNRGLTGLRCPKKNPAEAGEGGLGFGGRGVKRPTGRERAGTFNTSDVALDA